ncbi:MAG: hypothetical protein KJO21_03010 [Verrucomicrobiae bacterium]|nr:hypothetical protein [Verrucomicrobiae bacterium]NNJ41887.1 hypothetical protein [Akkermansiaceae bacterium]
MSKNPHSHKQQRIPPWRWAWLGFGLAAVLWLGSSAYFQRLAQIETIDSQSDAIQTCDQPNHHQSNMHKLMVCQISAGVLALASLTYLVSQVDIRRARPRPER